MGALMVPKAMVPKAVAHLNPNHFLTADVFFGNALVIAWAISRAGE